MIGSILTEVAHEIAVAPIRYLMELAQFALLIVIVYAVAWGFGAKRGFLRNILTERSAKLDARLAGALSSADELDHAKRLAALRLRSARAEGRDVLAEAKRQAADLTSRMRAQVDGEAGRVLARVDEALTTEKAEMEADVREQLVDLVAQATRQVLNERLTVGEQRRLIEEHVMRSIGPEPDPAAQSGAGV